MFGLRKGVLGNELVKEVSRHLMFTYSKQISLMEEIDLI